MNELELILTDILKCSRTDLYLNYKSITFKDREFRTLERILKDRGRVKPIQYILGHTDFMGLRLNTRKGVLIPRPETEILVETVISEAQKINNRKSKLKVLDVGTGAGCIAVALAKLSQNSDITATDISKEALDLAKENAKLNSVVNKIRFIKSDLFSHKIFEGKIKFDIIVSNPPYVPTFEIPTLGAIVNNEPEIALDGGMDGLDFYRRISKEARKFLNKEGRLILELGYGQSGEIKELFSCGWAIDKFIKDYQNIDRVCIIKRSSHG
ncbi:peptide chain release factor N(5)-glutamine methyltransferase [Candidatus Omnitrophota bacterium]